MRVKYIFLLVQFKQLRLFRVCRFRRSETGSFAIVSINSNKQPVGFVKRKRCRCRRKARRMPSHRNRRLLLLLELAGGGIFGNVEDEAPSTQLKGVFVILMTLLFDASSADLGDSADVVNLQRCQDVRRFYVEFGLNSLLASQAGLHGAEYVGEVLLVTLRVFALHCFRKAICTFRSVNSGKRSETKRRKKLRTCRCRGPAGKDQRAAV